jgi:hypothetical protein
MFITEVDLNENQEIEFQYYDHKTQSLYAIVHCENTGRYLLYIKKDEDKKLGKPITSLTIEKLIAQIPGHEKLVKE